MVSGCLWLLALLSVAHATEPVSTCSPARVFSVSGVTGVTDDFGKISESEILGTKALALAQVRDVPAGTELDAVVDIDCLAARDPSIKGHGLRSVPWKFDRALAFDQLRERVERDPCVRRVSRNVVYQMNALPSDPLISRQTHLDELHFGSAFLDFLPTMMAARRSVIAVIDSGVDFTHEDLALNRWTNVAEVAGNGIDDDGDGYVDDVHGFGFASGTNVVGPEGDLPEANHGTHVAGLAAGRVDNGVGGVGLDGVARVMSLNVFGKSNSTTSIVVENAIRYAADHSADVINLSLGGREFSRTMRDALNYAVAKGSFIVTAAGNFGMEICDDPESIGFVSPATYARAISGMVAVASVDAKNGKLSAFSNFSERLVEIAAPGAYSSDTRAGLLSTFPHDAYAELAGTSMAAPVVSGAAALVVGWLRAYGLAVTPEKVEKILVASARQEPTLKGFVGESRTLDLKKLSEYLRRNFRESETDLRYEP